MKKVAVIGGVRVNLLGKPFGELMYGTDNPGTISMEYSGTGRNIAMNLKKMGMAVDFFGVSGNDLAGKMSKHEMLQLGIDVKGFQLVDNENTPTYFEVLNLMDGLELAFGNGDVLKKVDAGFIKKHIDAINESEYIIVDGGIGIDGIEYLAHKGKGKLILDPATVDGAKEIVPLMERFHIILPNREEAEAITGQEILNGEQLEEGATSLYNMGVSKVFITLAAGGVYYKSEGESGLVPVKEMKPMANSEGAGAAFTAAIADGLMKEMGTEELVKYAMAAAEVKAEVQDVFNEDMSMSEVIRRM